MLKQKAEAGRALLPRVLAKSLYFAMAWVTSQPKRISF